MKKQVRGFCVLVEGAGGGGGGVEVVGGDLPDEVGVGRGEREAQLLPVLVRVAIGQLRGVAHPRHGDRAVRAHHWDDALEKREMARQK